jgi:arginine utilization protein RocB
MKSGLAAGIAVQEHFAEGTPSGNILLIATPDEEANSCGMRAAAERLPGLIESLNLDPIAAINLDVTVDRGDGREGQAIFLGSVGKVLPAVYLAGRETHAGAPFDGVNPNLLAAEITRRVECNVELSDVAEGEATPPPVSLKQIDLKPHYDVTTPAAAWCAYNLLTHGRTAGQVLPIMQRLVTEALDDVVASLREQARRFEVLSGQRISPPSWQPRVYTFAELRAAALHHGGASAADAVQALLSELEHDPAIDIPHLSRRVVELLWALSGLTGPAAVLAFASLYYPPVHVSGNSPRQLRVRAGVEREAAAFTRDTGVPIRIRQFFPGISDMSFLGCVEQSGDIDVMAANTPAWGTRIRHDYGVLQTLDLPTLNIGPWGRDYHQRTERVYTPYAFGQVPELIRRIIAVLLNDSPARSML